MDMMPGAPQNPYVGPRPFEREDQDRFFGRDQEAHELLSLIVANRAVVLYAQSGAGKTSLLNAQVSPMLEAEGFEVWPFARLQGPDIENVQVSEIKNIYSFYTLFSWAGEEADLAALVDMSIGQYLANQPHRTDEFDYKQPRVLIFDQFEELFTAFPARWLEREAFLNQINRALDEDPLLRVVFSLREDYVAQLYPYAHLLPRNLRTRFRLERMRADVALSAIRDPLRSTKRQFAPGVAEQLVEDLRALRVETISGETTTVTGEFVEPVQLQVVCQNLWEDLPEAVTTITMEHLQTFGNVDQALSSFYERAILRALPDSGLKEDELRRWIEESLITPAGTRSTVFQGATTTAGLANQAVNALENMHIIRGEYRAGSRWFELTHDRLIEPIQQSNRYWHDVRQQARIKRVRRLGFTAVALVALIGLGGYGLFFLLAATRNNIGDGDGGEASRIGATATAAEEMAAEERATANVALATATAEVTIASGVATSQYFANETATSEWIVVETAAAQTAVAQQATDTAVAQAILDATATAAVVNPTSTAVAAQATHTAAELDRLRVPIRPLQPGISIGNQNSATAGTLSAFVVDDQGSFFLLGPNLALGAADEPVLQPSPIDGGKPEDAVAFTDRRLPLADLPTIDAAFFINLARLEPGISFQTTVPGIGPIVGVREPLLEEEVWVYGRTSGLVERQIGCVEECSTTTSDDVMIDADFLLTEPLSSGDEGALVIDNEGFAVGIVLANTSDVALGASMTAVLAKFNVELITIGQQLAQYNLGRGTWAVSFSQDGSLLAATNIQGIHLFNLSEPETTSELLPGNEGQILSVAFSPDGTILASGGQDNIVRLWNISGVDEEPIDLKIHNNDVTALAFTPDGKSLASGSLDGTIYLWNLSLLDNEPIRVARLPHGIYALDISPDGQWLATGNGDGNIRIWNLSDLNTRPIILSGHDNIVTSIDFSPDSTHLVSAGFDGDVLIWDLTFPDNNPTTVAEDAGRTVAFSSDGNSLASSGASGVIGLWNLANPEAEPLLFFGHTDVVPSLAFSPNGDILASSSTDGTVRLWLVR